MVFTLHRRGRGRVLQGASGAGDACTLADCAALANANRRHAPGGFEGPRPENLLGGLCQCWREHMQLKFTGATYHSQIFCVKDNVIAMHTSQHGIRVAAEPNIAVDGLQMLVYSTAVISWTASLTSCTTSVQACSGRGCWRARRCMRCRCACRACSTSTPPCRPMRPGHPPRSPWEACACGARCPLGASRCTSTRRALFLCTHG